MDKATFGCAETGIYRSTRVDLSGIAAAGYSISQPFSGAMTSGETTTISIRKDRGNWAVYSGAAWNSGGAASLDLSAATLHESLGALASGDAVSVIGLAPSELSDLSAIAYTAPYSGSVLRTGRDKASDSVSVKDFGAIGDGVHDDTAAIQAALDSGAMCVTVPAGRYRFSALTMPRTEGFSLIGSGTAGVLVQTGAGITWPPYISGWPVYNTYSTLSELAFDGALGTGNTLDTTGVQTVEMLDLTFFNVPAGYSALKMDGHPATSTYCHDVRVRGIRIFNEGTYTGNGLAGIELGYFFADAQIDGFVMDGMFRVDYCILARPGAVTIEFSNSHPFNAKTNIVKLEGANNSLTWENMRFENSLEAIFVSKDAIFGKFTNCWFSAIASGKTGIILDNSYNNTFINTGFAGTTPHSAVKEINFSFGNNFIGGYIDHPETFTTPFDFGSGSYHAGIAGSAGGEFYHLDGMAQSAQAQATVRYLGSNGIGTTVGSQGWAAPTSGYVMAATVIADVTPAAGQTFVFDLYSGANLVGSGTISSGQYFVDITLSAPAVSKAEMVYIKSTFSATSGSATLRYFVDVQGH